MWSCSKRIGVRNAFCTPIRDAKLFIFRMFKICYVFHYFWPSCPPSHSLRNVLRALSLRSAEPPGRPSGHLSPRDRTSCATLPHMNRNCLQDFSLCCNVALAQRLGLLKMHTFNIFNQSHVCDRSRVVLVIGGASMKCGVFTA